MGALTLRKKSKTARVRSEFFKELSLAHFEKSQELRSLSNVDGVSNSPGLYLVTGSAEEIYVGGTLNLHERLATQFAADRLKHWEEQGAKSISLLPRPEGTDPIDLLSMQNRLIRLARPSLNVLGPTAA